MPRKSTDIEQIKYEIGLIRESLNSMKDSPLMSDAASKELIEEMKKLNASLEKLIHIFEVAQQDIIKNYGGEHPSLKLKRIEDQNRAIAQGLLMLNDKVEKLSKQIKEKPIKQETEPKTLFSEEKSQGQLQIGEQLASQQQYENQQFMQTQQTQLPTQAAMQQPLQETQPNPYEQPPEMPPTAPAPMIEQQTQYQLPQEQNVPPPMPDLQYQQYPQEQQMNMQPQQMQIPLQQNQQQLPDFPKLPEPEKKPKKGIFGLFKK